MAKILHVVLIQTQRNFGALQKGRLVINKGLHMLKLVFVMKANLEKEQVLSDFFKVYFAPKNCSLLIEINH